MEKCAQIIELLDSISSSPTQEKGSLMKAAIFSGVLGSALTFFLGESYLNIPWIDLVPTLFLANVMGLISLILTLQIQRTRLYSQIPVPGFLKSWALIVGLFLMLLVPISKPLQNVSSLLILLFPLGMSLGFCILVFGPIQDFIVRYRYQQEKLRKK